MSDRTLQPYEAWNALAARHWRELRPCLGDCPMQIPAALEREQLRSLVMSLLFAHRDLLREVLLDVLGQDIVSIAAAAAGEAGHAA